MWENERGKVASLRFLPDTVEFRIWTNDKNEAQREKLFSLRHIAK